MRQHLVSTLGNGPRTALDDNELRRLAPSIFAEAPHASRSERYGYVPTINVLAALRREGFVPVQAMQSKSRDESRREFTKHLVRFQHLSALDGTRTVAGVSSEVVMINSHDGSSAYKLMGGLFRMICTNGLIVADALVGAISVQHTGKITDAVIDASYEVLKATGRALDVTEEWRGITLNDDERYAFAEAAHELRFADAHGNVTTPIRPAQLLAPRREADAAPDLWTTFNVLQENSVRGGLIGHSTGETRRPRRVTTRQIKSIDGDVKLNRALWALGAKMADIKLGRDAGEPQHEPEVAAALEHAA